MDELGHKDAVAISKEVGMCDPWIFHVFFGVWV